MRKLVQIKTTVNKVGFVYLVKRYFKNKDIQVSNILLACLQKNNKKIDQCHL